MPTYSAVKSAVTKTASNAVKDERVKTLLIGAAGAAVYALAIKLLDKVNDE